MSKAREKVESMESNHEPLAIVGIGCRFPGGAVDPASFWNLLTGGQSGIVEVPENRWHRERFYHENSEIPGKMITKWGGFINDFDKFDAQFFGISPREALRMDPQQRWLLETAWECLEDAGMPPVDLRGSATGVFVGIASNDYANVAMGDPANVDVHTNSGSTLSIASNRIAYLFDFKGPALSVDTACSSALVAVNLACQSIWSGDCDMALAGGVNALLTPDASIGFSKASMLSPSGKCFAFDSRANGYVRGEGAGMIVLKPISKAVEDGDRVYAVVRAAVINQDGHTSSMTVPGVESQAAMLREAYKQAGMTPDRVTYMEAHGTGTPVGDPIETRALGQVLAEGRPEGEYCLIGSVKTNIGHLESGSGIAGLVKAALVLYHDTVPPNLNFKTPNPNIPFEEFKLKVATKLQPLPHLDGHAPVTAVNSFGFGGTNAHIVLEAAPVEEAAEKGEAPEPADRPLVLPLSGRGDDALRDTVTKFRRYLRANDSDSLNDIAAAAGEKREHLDNRIAFIGKDKDDICNEMSAWLAGENLETVVTGRPTGAVHPLVFVFTGQGAQWWAMGQELLAREPVFRKTLEGIDELLKPLAGWSLIEEMTRDEATSQINRTNIAQPAIFALQVGLAELWKSWGIEPSKVVGHSVGEVAAAYVAGVYTMEDAVKVIYHRSRLQDTTGGHGRMVAVGLSAEEGKKAIAGHEKEVEVAVINSPGMITLAGDTGPLEKIVGKLEEEGKFVRWLRIDYAFHTHQMEPIKDELLEVLADIKPMAAKIPFISTVTGGVLAGEKLDGLYWWRNVRESVLFAPALSGLIRAGEDSFLELGPHPALQSPINECLSDQKKKGVVFASLKRKTDESVEMLRNLCQLHLQGYKVDWRTVNQSSGAHVDLPGYAWQRERYWLESAASARLRLAPEDHPLLGLKVTAPEPSWRFELDPRYFAYLDDHRFWDSVVFPAAGYGEIGLAIARVLFPDDPYSVEDLEMKKALFISEKQVPTVEVVYHPDTHAFQIYSATGDKKDWELNAQGVLRKIPMPRGEEPVDFEAIRENLPTYYDHKRYYEEYEKAGYQFRPNFKQLTNVWRRKHESLAEIEVPEEVRQTTPDYHFHPAVLDACFHAVKGAQEIKEGSRAEDYFYLPASIHRVRLLTERAPDHLWAHCHLNYQGDDYVLADIQVYDVDGNHVAEILGFRADRVEQKDDNDLEKCSYQTKWEPVRLKGTGTEGSAHLTPVAEVLETVNALTPGLYEENNLSYLYATFGPQLDAAARQLMINALIYLGWKPEVGDTFTLEGFAKQYDVAPQHKRYLAAVFSAIEADGIVEPTGEYAWVVKSVPEWKDAPQQLRDLAAASPKFAGEVDLQMATGPYLGQVLCGEADPIDLLFPGGSSKLLEAFYRDAVDFPVLNELVRKALAKMFEKLPERRALRVLEVGAGTGSLTRAVLPAFPADRTEYVFTDNGPLFVVEAKDRFEECPFMEFAVLDIEKDPMAQKFEAHSFDLILGSNVLHATMDLKDTLANLRRCLAPDGMLMFLEATFPRPALDNVFGLLNGWWRYTDLDVRTDSALLTRDRWESLLTECGYREAGSFITSPKKEEGQQTVFIARAPEPVELPEEIEVTAAAAEAEVEVEEEAAPADVAILIGEGKGLSTKLSQALSLHGLETVTVDEKVESLMAKLEALTAEGRKVTKLVHLLSLEHPTAETLTLENLDGAQQTGVLHALEMAKALVALKPEPAPKVFFVLRGVQDAVEGDKALSLASSPVIGLIRVASNEHTEYGWTCVDLDAAGGDTEAEDLASEIALSDGEYEVAYRAGRRYARRLHRVKPDDMPPITRNAVQPDGTVLPYRLEIDKPGILSNLRLSETTRRDPEADEVEIQIKAGGINFRDVMKALGMYPGNPVDLKWFGDDLAGEVVRVGSNVKDLKPGDAVIGMAPYCFRSYVTVHRSMVFRKPAKMTFADAATLPTVFLTAHYGINELARMRKGESILVHAGTGGVGQAAIQIAKHLGLTIFATAGTPEKRALLKELGADYALDSRSLTFADEVMRLTGGKGVDAVLNSLAGDFIPKNFSVLATFGRYLEIGKIDVYGNSKIGLEPLRNNISFFVIDLAQHLEQKPEYVAEMFSELEQKFEDGAYLPLSNKVFPVTDVVEAFRYMAAGKHVGKNVLDFDLPEIPVGRPTGDGILFRENATYLITGGAGGFGLELAKWMVRHGARHLALMSRSGPKDQAVEDIAALEAKGVEVLDLRGDVTSPADVKDAVAKSHRKDTPLAGVVHGAMVLDDQFIIDLDEDSFMKVVRPKMLGAWNLHQATLDVPLDLFICFSSFSATIGPVKQSNYNAGNLFLDMLSHYRRAQGLPSLTFNWGALAGAGFVERNQKTQQYLEKVGLAAFNMDETLYMFRAVLPRDGVQVGAARVDWPVLARFSPSVGQSRMYENVVPRSGEGGGGDSMGARILEAPADKRLGMVEEVIVAQVAAVLETDATRIERSTPLTNLGLDSLMAIELVNRIEEKLGMSLPMGSVLNGPNIHELAIPILEKLMESGGGSTESTGTSVETVEFEITGDMPAEFPLTEGQRALWFLNRLAPNSSAYNLIFSGKFRPLLDIAAMKQAFSQLFERHPMLDVTFEVRNGEPVQVPRKGRTIDFREHDCTALNGEEIKKLISEHANQPFNLETGPVVRLELFRTSDDAHVALLVMHHIVSDAWSVVLIMQDLIESYFAIKAGRAPSYEAIGAGFHDFVAWEQKHLGSGAGEQMFDYWKEQLADAPTALDLPVDHSRPPVQTFNGGTLGFQIGEELTEQITGLAKEQNTTLFTMLLSAYEILLHRYCQQDDLLVGVPLAGRNHQDLQNMVGYFINPVPLRSRVDDDPTFAEYLERSRGQVNGAIENQQYPLAKLVDRLEVARDPGRSPLFQVSFSMERVPGVDEQGIAVFLIGQGGHTFHVGDLSMETVDLTTRQAQFEITLVMEEAGGHLYGCWQYNRDLFEPGTIERLNGLFAQVLEQITGKPEGKVSEIQLLSAEEQTRVLDEWNATDATYPKGKLIHQLFEERAAAQPDEPAVWMGEGGLTYGELSELSNGFAASFMEAGVEPGQAVAIFMERCPEMVAAMIGAWKVGAFYVPLDPEFPAQRLALMLEDAAPAVVVVSGTLASDLPEGKWEVLEASAISSVPAAPAVDPQDAESLAYIIYTSGSTGTPKGVEIPHRAAVNFLTSMQKTPGLRSDDRLLAVTTISFDISLLELFLPLISGAQIVLASRQEVRDGRNLSHLLRTRDITVMQATPATWQMLLDSGWEGQRGLRIFCGGEAISRQLANTLVNSAEEVWNLYGPTETTVWSTCQRMVDTEGPVSIGRPIANTRVYVLDHNKQPVPTGFTGELYIAGDGLALGYHGKPELTDAAFTTVDLPNGKTERIYRTGDLARWMPDGRLECLGRVDFQVKLRGVRLELGDIETHLEAHSLVRQAVVIKRDDLPAGAGLVAYVIPETDVSGTDFAAELRGYLAERLPGSMIPAYFVALEEFPETPNRKTDRKRLPAPTAGGVSGVHLAPETPAEKLLWEIFSKSFETQEFGIRDNFFELGGDSLMALRILIQVSDAFHQDVPVEAFLRHPTIESLARYLHQSEGQRASQDVIPGMTTPNLDDLTHLEVEEVADDFVPKVDAVALAYVPETLTALAKAVRQQVVQQWFAGGSPRLTNAYHTPHGDIGIIMIPFSELEFYKNPELAKDSIIQALELAAKAGAKTVSLTGVIPSATGHGRLIESWIEDRDDLPAITTGDATRAATVVKSVQGALEKAGRELAQERLAIVGLSSIGAGSLRLMLDVMPHPAELLLCDPYLDETTLGEIRDEIVESGYKGEVTIVSNGGSLPPEVYRASTIVASTNLPGVLDVDALLPGTLLVDYSFPPVFTVIDAVRRAEEDKDILFTTGGELNLGEEITETFYLPERIAAMADELEQVPPAFLRFLARRDPQEITGCILVSLLTGKQPEVKPTLGPLELADTKAHYELLEKMGVTPAHLQMMGYSVSAEAVENVKRLGLPQLDEAPETEAEGMGVS